MNYIAKSAATAAIALLAFSQNAHADNAELTVHAGSIGGTFFIMGAAMSDQWQNTIDGFRASVVPGGSLTNIMNVSQNADGSHVGLSYYPLMQEAWDNSGEFAELSPEPVQNIRTLVNLGYGSALHFVVLADAVPDGITTIDEFLSTEPAVNVPVGQRGSGGELNVRRTLEFNGVSYEDIEAWGGSVQFSDYSDAINGMRDGRIQAFWQDYPPFHPGVSELSISRDLHILSLDEETVQRFVDEMGTSPFVIPAGVYNNVDYPVDTIFQATMVVAHEAMDTDLAREMTLQVLQNKDRWVSAFRGMETFNPEQAWDSPIPLHEGSEQAFRELGYID